MSDIDTRPACHACGKRTNAAHETGYCSSLCDMRAQHAQACHELRSRFATAAHAHAQEIERLQAEHAWENENSGKFAAEQECKIERLRARLAELRTDSDGSGTETNS